MQQNNQQRDILELLAESFSQKTDADLSQQYCGGGFDEQVCQTCPSGACDCPTGRCPDMPLRARRRTPRN